MSYIVTAQWLYEQLNTQKEDIVVIDVRFDMGNPMAGEEAYSKSHLPEAFFLDIDKDLSGKIEAHGGNHPLPNMHTLAKKLGAIGVEKQKRVVLYDEEGGMFAARAWWLLHYMGHNAVYLLEGGWQGWLAKGFDVTDEVPTRQPVVFQPSLRENAVVHMEEVREKGKEQAAFILDSRSRDRYLGNTEPLYAKAGHIPGAKNFFWKYVLHEDGTWKNKEELEQLFSSLPKEEEIIVSCGSGISACPNIIGLKMAGFQNVKLYPGSFSDWISYADNRVEKTEE